MGMYIIDYLNSIKKLLGEPYTKYDCIKTIMYPLKKRCAGTNWLYRSINNSNKYRYITFRSKDMGKIENGAIVFKIEYKIVPNGYKDIPNAFHVGVYLKGEGVLHSSPSTGVRISSFNPNDWDEWALLKDVDYTQDVDNYVENYDDVFITIQKHNIYLSDYDAERIRCILDNYRW